jgi:hypothetical protein
MTSTTLHGEELDRVLDSVKQQAEVQQAIDSFNLAFSSNSLPAVDINAAFLGDVRVAEGTSTSVEDSTREKLLQRLEGLTGDAAAIAALKAEYEAQGGEFPKHVRGRPTSALIETSRLFPHIIKFN